MSRTPWALRANLLGVSLPARAPGAAFRGVSIAESGGRIVALGCFRPSKAAQGPWSTGAAEAPGSSSARGPWAALSSARPPLFRPHAGIASQGLQVGSRGAVAKSSLSSLPQRRALHDPAPPSAEEMAAKRRFRAWRDSAGADHEEALGPTEAHLQYDIDQRSLLMEQVRSIWVVRNGAAGASLALGAVFSACTHGTWDAILPLADPRTMELVFGPFLATSGTLCFFHFLRRTEDLCLKFTREEREERAYSSKGPLGFAAISLLAGIGSAITGALLFAIEVKRSGLGTHHKPLASFESFTVLY